MSILIIIAMVIITALCIYSAHKDAEREREDAERLQGLIQRTWERGKQWERENKK